MAVVVLPLLNDLGATPHYRFRCILEGKAYEFEVMWNDRDGCWWMQIGDALGKLLAGSIRVLLGQPLFHSYEDTRLPPGVLVAKDTSGSGLDAGLQDLGSRVQVWYWESTSVAAALSGVLG